MNWKQYGTVASVFLVIIAILTYLQPEGRPFVSIVVSLLLFLASATILFIGPASLGWEARNKGVEFLDDLIGRDEEMNVWQRSILGFFMSIIVGYMWIFLVPLLVQPWNWLDPIMRLFAWSGAWEPMPVGWGIYALVTFLLGWGAKNLRFA